MGGIACGSDVSGRSMLPKAADPGDKWGRLGGTDAKTAADPGAREIGLLQYSSSNQKSITRERELWANRNTEVSSHVPQQLSRYSRDTCQTINIAAIAPNLASRPIQFSSRFYQRHETTATMGVVSLTVGKVDAGVTVLLTPDKRLVRLSPLVLPCQIYPSQLTAFPPPPRFPSNRSNSPRSSFPPTSARAP